MFKLFKDLFGKRSKDKSPVTSNWIPKVFKPRETFADAGMSVRRQKRKAKNRKRDRIAKMSRKINYRRAA